MIDPSASRLGIELPPQREPVHGLAVFQSSGVLKNMDANTFYLPPSLYEHLSESRSQSFSKQQLVESQPLMQLLQTSLYMISNNLFSQYQVHGLVRWIDSSGYVNALQKIARLQTPSVEDFSARLFTSAVHTGKVNVVRALLVGGISMQHMYRYPRKEFPNKRNDPRTALGAAVRSGHCAMVELLMSFGANPNTGNDIHNDFFLLIEQGLMSALHAGVRSHPRLPPLLDILDSLINAGLRFKQWEMPRVSIAYELAEIAECSRLLELFHQAGFVARPRGNDLNEMLHDAVGVNYIDLVRNLIGKGADVNSWSRVQGTPLVIAANKGHIGMIQVLLEFGADPNMIPACGRSLIPVDCSMSALHMAVSRRNHAMVELLLARGAHPSTFDRFERTPLHWAMLGPGEPPMEIARTLLLFGADVNAHKGRSTAIHGALRRLDDQWEKMAELLLRHGARILWILDPVKCLGELIDSLNLHEEEDKNSVRRAIHFCREHYDRHTSQHVGAHFATFPAWLSKSLDKALDQDSLDLAHLLLEAGADASQNAGFIHKPSWPDYDGLWQDVMCQAIENGADINSYNIDKGRIPYLQVAIDAEDFAMVSFLLCRGARTTRPPGPGMLSPLHMAVSRPKDVFAHETAKFLLSYGADLEAYELFHLAEHCCPWSIPFSSSERALWSKPRATIGRGLLEGNLTIFGFHGTPFQAACFSGSRLVIRLLRDVGADIQAPASTEMGFTALQIAVARGRDQIVQELLEAGVDINAPSANHAGFTALQCAILSKNSKLTNRLLASGADVNAPAATDVGCTALQAAAMTRNVELVRALLDAGADANAPGGNEYGRTALEAACFEDMTDVAELLLEHGADVNARPCRIRGATALQCAAMKGNLDLVIKLLEQGANIDAPGAEEWGRTALEAAAENGRLDIVYLFLQEHPEPLSLENACEQAAELAMKQEHDVIAKVLRGWNDPSSPYSPFYCPDELEGF